MVSLGHVWKNINRENKKTIIRQEYNVETPKRRRKNHERCLMTKTLLRLSCKSRNNIVVTRKSKQVKEPPLMSCISRNNLVAYKTCQARK